MFARETEKLGLCESRSASGESERKNVGKLWCILLILGTSSSSSNMMFLRSLMRTGRHPSPLFWSYQQASEYVRELGFRTRMEFDDWSGIGRRPSFIPSNPRRTYKDLGWISYPDFLGYERKTAKPREILAPHIVARQQNAIHEKKAFTSFVTSKRPDVEFHQLPEHFKTSHLLRISSRGNSADPPDLWIPLQLRFGRPLKKRPNLIYFKPSAEPGTAMIVLSSAGAIARLSDEFRPVVSMTDFEPPEKIFDVLDSWWDKLEKRPQADWICTLRHQRRCGAFWSDEFAQMKTAYFDPLGLSVECWNKFDGSLVNVLCNNTIRIVFRIASVVKDGHAQVNLNLGSRSRFGRKRFADSGEVDFLIVCLPSGGAQVAGVGVDLPSLFLFPRSYLLAAGVMGTDSQKGKYSMYLYPPWKKDFRKVTIVKKAEQAQFFVESVERFAEILKTYGNVASVSSGKSEHGEHLHVAKV